MCDLKQEKIALLLPLKVTLMQITCTVNFIRSKCNKGCDWCIYVTVVTCANTTTYILSIQQLLLPGEL